MNSPTPPICGLPNRSCAAASTLNSRAAACVRVSYSDITRSPTVYNRVLLGVNVDHVATLRQARGTRYPDPVQAALEAEQAGADGITIHPREDRRHIQDRDVLILKETQIGRASCRDRA